MYRVGGPRVTLDKDASVDTALESRKIGQLVRLTVDGKAAVGTGTGDAFFPLIQDLDGVADLTADVQVGGIAKVYVETASGIEAGTPVSAGSTALGVQIAQDGEFILGIALAKPAANGVFIPVLIAPAPPAASY